MNKPYIYSKNELAKKLVWENKYYKYMIDKIDYCLDNKEKLYINYTKLCDEKNENFVERCYLP